MTDEPTTQSPAEALLSIVRREVEHLCKMLVACERACVDRSEVAEEIAPLVKALEHWTQRAEAPPAQQPPDPRDGPPCYWCPDCKTVTQLEHPPWRLVESPNAESPNVGDRPPRGLRCGSCGSPGREIVMTTVLDRETDSTVKRWVYQIEADGRTVEGVIDSDQLAAAPNQSELVATLLVDLQRRLWGETPPP